MNLKNSKSKRILFSTAILIIFSLNILILNSNMNFTPFYSPENTLNSIEDENPNNLLTSEWDEHTEDWIKNGNFSDGNANWYNITEGDEKDVNASISQAHANFEVLGDNGTFSLVADPPVEGPDDWLNTTNPNFPTMPDNGGINEEGIWAYHHWSEGADQSPSVHWENNVSTSVNMSDYIITSASLRCVVNGTVKADNGDSEGVEAVGDTVDGGGTQYATYDYARFYVLISDLEKNKVYEVAYNQTVDLGKDSAGDEDQMDDTEMLVVSEEALIFYLTSALSTDNYNFTITLGIRIWCEDNWYSDNDFWESLIINYFNLTFTYEKKIDQLTSVSWNQDGDKIDNDYVINNATLNFKYKIINGPWPTSSSNSRIRIIINDNIFSETILLTSATSSWQKAKSEGFDITPLITSGNHVNLSIQVYIPDQFALDRIITLSIDNVSLNISYNVYTTPKNTKLDLFLNKENKTLEQSIEVSIGETVNITVMYTNTSGDFIPDATVELTGSGFNEVLPKHVDYDQYNMTIDTTNLEFGDNYLTIYAHKRYYDPQTISNFKIKVTNRYAYIDKIYLNGTESTSIDQLPSGDPLNITITYVDNLTKNYIENATVELRKSEILVGNFNNKSGFEQYNYTYNTTDLGQGVYYLTVYAEQDNYTSDYVQLTVVIDAKGTNNSLYLNGTIEPNNEITATINQIININMTYNDYYENFVDGAIVDINGSGISKLLIAYNLKNYSTTINTKELNQGNNRFDIYARCDGYISQSITLWVHIVQRQTDLFLYINDTFEPVPADFVVDADDLTIGDMINITVSYLDNKTGEHIDSAIVSLNGTTLSEALSPTGNNYSYVLDSNHPDLNRGGVNYLSVNAERTNYEPQSITIKLTIISKKTDFNFFLNNENKTSDEFKSIKLPWNENLNITVMYRDLDGPHINLATVDLNGTGISELLEETGQQYNITINTADLSVGITYLTIVAQKKDYGAQTIVFKVEVNDRITDLTVFLDGTDKTSDPTISVAIGKNIEIKVKYLDNSTKNHVNGAMVNLTGEGISTNFTENAALKEHSITISSADLDVGIRFLTILAQEDNYASQTLTVKIVVERRRTEIVTVDGNTTINKKLGENINISVTLKDLDFSRKIKNARVNYTWELGQGALLDENKDGVYEVILENVPEGTYTVTITVYASDDYDFERFQITINVVRPPEETLMIYVLGISSVVAAICLGGYLVAYQKVLKYPKPVRKVRKFRKTLKKKKLTGIEIASRESALKSLYGQQLGKLTKLIKGKTAEEKAEPDVIADKILDKRPEKIVEDSSEEIPEKTQDRIEK